MTVKLEGYIHDTIVMPPATISQLKDKYTEKVVHLHLEIDVRSRVIKIYREHVKNI
jgi:hypothetical protein